MCNKYLPQISVAVSLDSQIKAIETVVMEESRVGVNMAEALKRHFDILKMLSKDRALKTSEVHQKLEQLGHTMS